MRKSLLLIASAAMSVAAMAQTYSLGERVSELKVGEKYFIFNTAMNGAQDRTGVLYDGGAETLTLMKADRTTALSEEHTVTLEEGTLAGIPAYAIKTGTGKYVSPTGALADAAADVMIERWDVAEGAKSGVSSLLADWTVGAVDPTTTWLIGSGTTFWNGNPDAFATWTDGHPFVFYTVKTSELSEEDSKFIADMNNKTSGYLKQIADATQAKLGLVTSYEQFSSNYPEPSEGPLADIMDGDLGTFFHSQWSGNPDPTIAHNLQVNLGDVKAESFRFIMGARANNLRNRPTSVLVETSEDGDTWTEVDTCTFTPSDAVLYTFSEALTPASPASQIRFTVLDTNSDDYPCFSMGEFYVVKPDATIDAALAAYDAAKAEVEAVLAGTASSITTKAALEEAIAAIGGTTGVNTVVAPEVAQPEITIDLMGRKVSNIEGRRTLKKGNVTIVL